MQILAVTFPACSCSCPRLTICLKFKRLVWWIETRSLSQYQRSVIQHQKKTCVTCDYCCPMIHLQQQVLYVGEALHEEFFASGLSCSSVRFLYLFISDCSCLSQEKIDEMKLRTVVRGLLYWLNTFPGYPVTSNCSHLCFTRPKRLPNLAEWLHWWKEWFSRLGKWLP